MGPSKSLDEVEIIIALVRDVHKSITVITPRVTRLTAAKLRKRYSREGFGFLSKTLPSLGKALTQGLADEHFTTPLGFRKEPGSQLPRFLGELFSRVFCSDGNILPQPDVKSIAALRDILYCFYKYELPYSKEIKHEVLSSFKTTDGELSGYNNVCRHLGPGRGNFLLPDSDAIGACCDRDTGCSCAICPKADSGRVQHIVTKARRVLNELFRNFDHRDIYPNHGPGSVSTKETGPEKWRWTNIPDKLVEKFPLDEYFYASLGAVCDSLDQMQSIQLVELPAKVVLVPKDSRGPRLISEECLANQFIQQGLREALYSLVERHPLSRYNVHFTDQSPNQMGAYLGSRNTKFRWSNSEGREVLCTLDVGAYATLDLKEASDRVSVGLIQLLFPPHVVEWAMATRSRATVLPTGEEITLNKFAPMGSALCFPFMALTIWALLKGAGLDGEGKGTFLVYGDDVVVPTAQAEYAITTLESFGLLVNRSKSFTKGFFRESCGVDAFLGYNVTPIKLKKVWTSSRCPDTLEAWCSAENAYFKRGYYETAMYIADNLRKTYGYLPPRSNDWGVPSLCSEPDIMTHQCRRRFNQDFQRWESHVWASKPRTDESRIPGWSQLLRYFCNKGRPKPQRESSILQTRVDAVSLLSGEGRSSIDKYTRRRSNKLIRRWVPERPISLNGEQVISETLVDKVS